MWPIIALYCITRIEAPRGVSGGGVPLPIGVGSWVLLCPLPRKFFDFGFQNGELWCILGGIFYLYFKPVLQLTFLQCMCTLFTALITSEPETSVQLTSNCCLT